MEPPIKPGETWRLTVFGHAVPQGDLTAMPIMKHGTREPLIGKGGRPVINTIHSNHKELKPWRQEVAIAAIAAGWPGMGVAELDESVVLRLTFYVRRPASHYGTGRNAGQLKDSAPLYPERTGGDLDKLTRAVLDAITGIVVKDDKRVVTLPARKRFGTPERLELALRRPRVRTVGDLRELRGVDPEVPDVLADEMQLDLFAAAALRAQQTA